jgi:hypothetical protein
MNINIKLKPGGLLFAMLLSVGLAPSAWAGTAADTNVTNSASVDYEVGGVNQADVTSNLDDFEVDRLIDLSVAEASGSFTGVVPDQTTFDSTTGTIRFTVTNQGNDVQDFNLTAANQADATADPFGGNADNWDTQGAFTFYLDDGDGVFEPGVGAGLDGAAVTFIDELAASASVDVWVEPADIPANDPGNTLDGDPDQHMDNGNNAVVSLVATARAGGGATVLGAVLVNDLDGDLQGTVENVFGDANGPYDGALDAAESDDDAFRVNNATITLSKSSAVTTDPVNGITNPKRIPGATIRYSLTVANTAGASADAVTITDVIDVVSLDETSIVVFFDVDDDGTCEAGEAAHASITYTAATDTVAIDVDAGETAATAGTNQDGDLDATESLLYCYDIDIN